MSSLRSKWLNVNTLLAATGLLVAVLVFYASRAYPYAPVALGGSPALYPRIIAVALAILCLGALVEGLIKTPQVTWPRGANLLRLLTLWGLLALVPLAFEWLGFRVMGFALALGAMVLLTDADSLNWRNLLVFVAVAAIASQLLHVIFEVVARVPLPRGRLF